MPHRTEGTVGRGAGRQGQQQAGVGSAALGLVPYWANQPNTGYSLIDAKAETVAEKPSYRRAFQRRRCLIVADGFYEW